MGAKRLDRRVGIALSVALATFAAAGSASAQYVNGRWQAPATATGPRQAVEKKPDPAVIVQQPTVFRQPVAFTLVPAVVMSDGSVFANFGFGYEQVLRPCSAGIVVGQPTVIAGNGVVLSQAQQPTYTQPVPNQQTPSQQMLQSGQQQHAQRRSNLAQLSCYSRDAAGRVFVYR